MSETYESPFWDDNEMFEEEYPEEVTCEQIDHANNCYNDLCCHLAEADSDSDTITDVLMRDPEDRSFLLRCWSINFMFMVYVKIHADLECMKIRILLPLLCPGNMVTCFQQFLGSYPTNYGHFRMDSYNQVFFYSQVSIADTNISKRSFYTTLHAGVDQATFAYRQLMEIVQGKSYLCDMYTKLFKGQIEVLERGNKEVLP